MGVGAVLALSVPFVAVLGWISANQFEGFFLKNWRDNEKEYKIYDASVRGRIKQNAFYQKGYCKDLAFTVLMLAICTAVGFCFLKLGFTDTNIVMIYILGVLLTAVVTKGYVYSVASAFLSVLLFGFFLTEPRLSFQTYAVGYPVTFAVMLLAAIITGTLAAQLKAHAEVSSRQAFRIQVLFDTNRLLQRKRDEKDILRTTCEQLTKLFDCSIVAYLVEDDRLSEGMVYAGGERVPPGCT